MTGSGDPRAEGLGPVAIAVIVALGIALSALLSLNLRRQQNLEIAGETEAHLQALSRIGVFRINALYADLQRRGALWTTLRHSEGAALRMDAFIEENPSILALAYPATGNVVSGTPDAVALLHTWQAEGHPAESILGPRRLPDGRIVLGAILRISYLASDQRSILAVVEPERLLDPAFSEAATGGYGFSVSLGDVELLRHDAGSSGDLQQLARQTTINPVVGDPWTLSVWPLPSAIPESYRQGPIVALVAGLLTSAITVLALHFGALSWRRARVLAEANLELERRVIEAQRSQGELRELSAQLEQRVAERTAILNETVAELETFNYSVSHDLRSPLAAIINFAAIFAEDYAGRLDATQSDYLHRISRSALSAIGLMDGLLMYSHSGRTELRRVHIDVRRLVLEICEEQMAAFPDRGHEMKVGSLPDAFADESMLRSIFTNLISNACKFVKPGEVARIDVDGRIEGNEVVYTVRDEGIGFDPRFEHKLFKAFERLHHSSQFEGHGIGLAIVARMVRRHGGRFWAQGAVEKGATFHFTIPIPKDGSNRKSAA